MTILSSTASKYMVKRRMPLAGHKTNLLRVRFCLVLPASLWRMKKCLNDTIFPLSPDSKTASSSQSSCASKRSNKRAAGNGSDSESDVSAESGEATNASISSTGEHNAPQSAYLTTSRFFLEFFPITSSLLIRRHRWILGSLLDDTEHFLQRKFQGDILLKFLLALDTSIIGCL